MIMSPAKIRPAKTADIPFLAWAMLESMRPGPGVGLFEGALDGTGTNSLEFHEALLRAGANNWGPLDSFLVIEADGGKLAGAMGAFLSDIPDLRPLTGEGFAAVSQGLGWSDEIKRQFWRRYVSFFGLFGTAPQLIQPYDYVIEYAAILPEFRRQGLYANLLNGHIERARQLGHSTLGGTAVFGNEAVQAAYQRLGFREHSRFGPEYYRGAYPGMIRMIYDLKATA